MLSVKCCNQSRAGNVRQSAAGVVVAGALFLAVLLSHAAQAQSFSVIYNFTGAADGQSPYAGVAIDRQGNLYGTAFYGGVGFGTVYRLKRSGSNWIMNPLYSFLGGNDGAFPYAGVTIGPDGALYGATYNGGGSGCNFGCGTVFRLAPPPSACVSAVCPWNETVLYRFSGGADGKNPYGGVVFDSAGSLYGTTFFGGSASCNGGGGCGVVYKLTRSGNSWTQSVIYSFLGGSDGVGPEAGVTLDASGNLYGTTTGGGLAGLGTVFQLVNSGSGWSENQIYFFSGPDGASPFGGVVFDSSGNLYGTTYRGGPYGVDGLVYELSPSANGWLFSSIYNFSGSDGKGPFASVMVDTLGNVYGTTNAGGLPPQYDGTAFKLSSSGGSWTLDSLHQFIGSDGVDPACSLSMDSSGNLFGTTPLGGTHGTGVIFEIAP